MPDTKQFCDLVMKGGITSGIVYPPFVERLSRHYRFKSIGGTSAGAIAAVLTAAAEYHRRQFGVENAFDELGALPKELGADSKNPKTSKLFSLFQPAPTCRRLFHMIVAAFIISVTTRHPSTRHHQPATRTTSYPRFKRTSSLRRSRCYCASSKCGSPSISMAINRTRGPYSTPTHN